MIVIGLIQWVYFWELGKEQKKPELVIGCAGGIRQVICYLWAVEQIEHERQKERLIAHLQSQGIDLNNLL